LQTFSYIFYFPSCLIGPSFEFSDFIKFIFLEKDYKNISYQHCNRATIDELLISIFCILVTVFFAKPLNIDYCGSEEFKIHSLIYKIFYYTFAMYVVRCKYYVGWKITSASVIFCGLGYKEDSGIPHKCDRIEGCNLWKIEANLNPKEVIQYWNRTVHIWLKYYVFMRIVNQESKFLKGNHFIATIITFFISAFWHGFYPVYYLFFVQYFLIEQIASILEKKYDIFNKIKRSNDTVKIIWWLIEYFYLTWFGASFILLTVPRVINFYESFYYIPNISLILTYVYFGFITKNKKIKLDKD
jgi:lysophospholipid acyltransferase